jgi:OOP family OmpA-OmpF porin
MKKFAPLLLASLLAAPAFANEGGVFGLDYGRTKISDTDINGNGAGVFGGYRFNDSFAVELGYRQLFNETTRSFGVPVAIKGTALQASVVGYLPLGQDFSLYGRLGYNKLKAKASAGAGSASETESKSLFGFGAEYAFSKSVSGRIEYQKPASDTSSMLFGIKFSF